jgi:hypothetical protein
MAKIKFPPRAPDDWTPLAFQQRLLSVLPNSSPQELAYNKWRRGNRTEPAWPNLSFLERAYWAHFYFDVETQNLYWEVDEETQDLINLKRLNAFGKKVNREGEEGDEGKGVGVEDKMDVEVDVREDFEKKVERSLVERVREDFMAYGSYALASKTEKGESGYKGAYVGGGRAGMDAQRPKPKPKLPVKKQTGDFDMGGFVPAHVGAVQMVDSGVYGLEKQKQGDLKARVSPYAVGPQRGSGEVGAYDGPNAEASRLDRVKMYDLESPMLEDVKTYVSPYDPQGGSVPYRSPYAVGVPMGMAAAPPKPKQERRPYVPKPKENGELEGYNATYVMREGKEMRMGTRSSIFKKRGRPRKHAEELGLGVWPPPSIEKRPRGRPRKYPQNTAQRAPAARAIDPESVPQWRPLLPATTPSRTSYFGSKPTPLVGTSATPTYPPQSQTENLLGSRTLAPNPYASMIPAPEPQNLMLYSSVELQNTTPIPSMALPRRLFEEGF